MEFFFKWLIKQISMGIIVILGEVRMDGGKEEGSYQAHWALHCSRAKFSLW